MEWILVLPQEEANLYFWDRSGRTLYGYVCAAQTFGSVFVTVHSPSAQTEPFVSYIEGMFISTNTVCVKQLNMVLYFFHFITFFSQIQQTNEHFVYLLLSELSACFVLSMCGTCLCLYPHLKYEYKWVHICTVDTNQSKGKGPSNLPTNLWHNTIAIDYSDIWTQDTLDLLLYSNSWEDLRFLLHQQTKQFLSG